MSRAGPPRRTPARADPPPMFTNSYYRFYSIDFLRECEASARRDVSRSKKSGSPPVGEPLSASPPAGTLLLALQPEEVLGVTLHLLHVFVQGCHVEAKGGTVVLADLRQDLQRKV